MLIICYPLHFDQEIPSSLKSSSDAFFGKRGRVNIVPELCYHIVEHFLTSVSNAIFYNP